MKVCGMIEVGFLYAVAVLMYSWALSGVAAQKVTGGAWQVVVENGGVSAMHMATTHQNTVVMFDRTDFGPSQLLLDRGRCRDNPLDQALKHDCFAHSVEYDIPTNKVRPLMIRTDTWCSSGAFAANGSLVHTGGFNDGSKAIRYFVPCTNALCDWDESQAPKLKDNRWYAANQILPDGRIIVVGGTKVFTYEFVPQRTPGDPGSFALPFLIQTNTRNVENNLYPFLHLSSDGNLFIFANRDSILFDYKNNRVVRTYPKIPGGPRNYPSTGSSSMLPLTAADRFQKVQILICGGATDGGYAAAKAKKFIDGLKSCGRMVITDANATWVMEDMPTPRLMSDMLILPTGEILIINGAQKGAAGWDMGRNPVLAPLLYRPNEALGNRFTVLGASTIPRMYHSVANVLPDGRILVGGSNDHFRYEFSGVLFPTELRLETYSPYYLDASNGNRRPRVTAISSTSIRYGARFVLRFSVAGVLNRTDLQIAVYAPPFTTHSTSMSQRMLILAASRLRLLSSPSNYSVRVTAPPTAVAAPPGYYMLFVLNAKIPSIAQWVRFF